MNKFLSTWKADFQSGVPFVIWGALTAIVGFSGPFGTYRLMDFLPRMAFWAFVLALAITAGTAVRALVFGVWNMRSFRYGSTTIALLLAIFFPALFFLVMRIPVLQAGIELPSWVEVSIFTGLCSLAVGAYRSAMIRKSSTLQQNQTYPESPPEAETVGQAARLLDRLPKETVGNLMSISVRDHYVDVRTDSGTTSLLLRLSDAISETEGVDGAQIHRSHWVAWDAVTAAERSGTRMTLKLRDGSTLPVSKTYRDIVEERIIGRQ